MGPNIYLLFGVCFLKDKEVKAEAFVLQALLQSLEIKQKSNFLQNISISTFPCVTLNELVQQIDLEEKKKKGGKVPTKP